MSGVKDVTVPESRGIYLGMDSDSAGGIDICADTNQYIDFTSMLSNFKWRLIYNVTNNDFKMHVNGNASASLTLNHTILTTSSITCGLISCTGSGTKPTKPSAAGVYLGLDSSAAGGMEICCSTSRYIDFTTIGTDFKGRLIYAHVDHSFNWQVGVTTTSAMKLLSIGFSVNGTADTSDKRLKF